MGDELDQFLDQFYGKYSPENVPQGDRRTSLKKKLTEDFDRVVTQMYQKYSPESVPDATRIQSLKTKYIPVKKDAGFFESFGKGLYNVFANVVPESFRTSQQQDVPKDYQDYLFKSGSVDVEGKEVPGIKTPEGLSLYGVPTPSDFKTKSLDDLVKTYSKSKDQIAFGRETEASISARILKEAKEKLPEDADPELVQDFFVTKYNSELNKARARRGAQAQEESQEGAELMKNVPTSLEEASSNTGGFVGAAIGEGLGTSAIALPTYGAGAFVLEQTSAYKEAADAKAKMLSERYGSKITGEELATYGDDEDVRAVANTVGAINGGLEYVGSLFGLGKTVKILFGRKVVKEVSEQLVKKGLAKSLTEVPKGMMAEGVTEWIQDINTQVGAKTAAGLSIEDALAEVDLERATEAFVKGAIPGGAFGTVTAAAKANQQRVINNEVDKIVASIPVPEEAAIKQDIALETAEASPVAQVTPEVTEPPVVEQTTVASTEETAPPVEAPFNPQALADEFGSPVTGTGQEVSDQLVEFGEGRFKNYGEFNSFIEALSERSDRPITEIEKARAWDQLKPRPDGAQLTKGERRDLSAMLPGEVRAERPVKTTEYNLLKERFRNFARGFREGRMAEKEDITAVQDELRNYLKTNLPTEEFRKSDVTQLVNAISSAKTNATFLSSVEKIDKLIDKAYERQAIRLRDQALEMTKPSKFKKSEGGITKGRRVTESVAGAMKNLHNLIKTPPADLDAQFEALDQKLQDGTATVEDLDKLEAIQGARYVLSDDVDEVQAGLDFIKILDSAGRTAFRERAEQIVENNKRLRETAIADITGGKGIKVGFERKKLYDQKKKPFERFKQGVSDFLNRGEAWDFLLDIVSQAPRKEGGFAGPLYEIAGRPVGNSRAQYDAGVQAKLNLTQTKLKEIYGDRAHKAIVDNSISRPVPGLGGSLSQNEAYYLYNLLQDPTLDKTFEKMGYTPDVREAITNYLKPEVKTWADWLRTEFYPQYYPEINEVYKQLYFIDLPFNPNYSPMSRDVEGAVDESVLGFRNSSARVMNPSLKERVKNVNPIKIQDGDSVLAQYMAKMEHFKSFASTIQQLNTIFKDGDVRESIRQTSGQDALNNIDQFIRDMAQNGVDRSNNIQMIDKIRANFTTATLGLNPTITLKQMTAFPAYLAEIPTTEFFKGIGIVLTNPKKAYDTLMKSPYMKDRYSSGFDRDMAVAMARDYKKIMGTKNLAAKLMFLVSLGDKGSILFGGYGAYNYHYNKAKKSGLSDSEANFIALREFEEITKKSQQSSNIEDLSSFQRGGSIAKLMTMFKTSPMQYFRQERKAVRDFVRGNNRTKAAKRFMVYHFLLPSLFQYVASGFPGLMSDWDDEDSEDMGRALSLGSLNGIFIVGDILWYLTDKLLDKPYAEDLNITPAFTTVAKIVTEIDNAYDAADDKEAYEALIELGSLGLDLTGVPASRVKKYINNYKYINESNLQPQEEVLIWGGYSPYTVQSKPNVKQPIYLPQ
jgi:hypothetical protein